MRDEVETLFLVGDMFEHFIEYRHSIPKGFIRFMALLAEWTDSGIPVVYLVGNHDPWHRDFFEKEIGVTVVYEPITEQLSGLRVHVAHGDGLGNGAAGYRILKPILRHPLPVGIFTGLLPSDVGLGIAKWYSRTFRKTVLNPARVEALRVAAREILDRTGSDIVVMGHSHHPEATRWESGTYINLGSWYEDRAAGLIDNGEASLVVWKNGEVIPFSGASNRGVDG
jgi:UDP-2,3-diacylglucosamine hydrolase